MKCFKRLLTIAAAATLGLLPGWGQRAIYLQRNDSIVKHIGDSISATKPDREKNAYKEAVGKLFDTYWKNSKAKLPLADVKRKRDEIDRLQKQIQQADSTLTAVNDSVSRLSSLVSAARNEQKILRESAGKQHYSADSTSMMNLAADTIRLTAEIEEVRQKIEEQKQRNGDLAQENELISSLIVKEQDNMGMKLALFNDDVDNACKAAEGSLIGIDTLLLQRVLSEYESFGTGLTSDPETMKIKMAKINYVADVAAILQRSIRLMAEEKYVKAQNDKMIKLIEKKERGKTLSQEQKRECADIRMSLDYQEVAYLSLQYIVDEIEKKHSDGFKSVETLEKAEVTKAIIDFVVKDATDGKLDYDKYYVNQNEALRKLRSLFAPENYARNRQVLYDRTGMTDKLKEIKMKYGL